MLPYSMAQHRTKHINLLLARKLSFIEREHLQNLMNHQRLENSIRRASDQASNHNRKKISIPFDHIYNERTALIDYHNVRDNNITSNQKRCLSFGTTNTSSTSSNQKSLDQSDEFSDGTSSSSSFQRRRYCTKTQHLPPLIKANLQKKRENKNHSWMMNFQPSKESLSESFTIFNEESSKPLLPELTPIQRQVRSFLETLPAYKGVQHGFDSFASTSLYTHRVPVAIR